MEPGAIDARDLKGIFDAASNSKEILKERRLGRETGRMMYVPIVPREREKEGRVVSTFSMIFTCVRTTVERLSNSGFYSAGTAYM